VLESDRTLLQGAKITFPRQLFANRRSTYFENNATGRNTIHDAGGSVTGAQNNKQLHTVLPRIRTILSLFPYVFHFPWSTVNLYTKQMKYHARTFMQTGISGNTRRYTLHPLTTLIFRLMTSSAVVSCFAVNRTPGPLILKPQMP
jgi:hypothetical protein